MHRKVFYAPSLCAATASVALLSAAPCAADIPPAEAQIAAAVQAAPAARRDGATVLGYDSEGELATLREGSNDLICLYDDPSDDRWSVACYHQDLEPYMARGRQLSAEGVTGQARNDIRWKEVEAGELPVPEKPATLYVLHGSDFDPDTGEVVDPYLRWVLYVPWATAESTGLSTQPAESAPWLMDPGTPGAHIMINPPRAEE